MLGERPTTSARRVSDRTADLTTTNFQLKAMQTSKTKRPLYYGGVQPPGQVTHQF